jgi:phosphatidylglycerophosphate synthase
MESFIGARYLLTGPNLLTFFRPVCAGLFVWLCAQAQDELAVWSWVGAMLCFVCVVASDALDGWMARRLRQASALGLMLDHICDVLFILIALGFFAIRDLVPWWLPMAIAWAFGLYVLHSWCLTAGRRPMTFIGSRLGRLSGILNYGAVGLVTIHLYPGATLVPTPLLQGCFTTMAFLGLMSGAERFVDLLRAPRVAGHATPEVGTTDRSDCSTT